jgi:hypothetical protein
LQQPLYGAAVSRIEFLQGCSAQAGKSVGALEPAGAEVVWDKPSSTTDLASMASIMALHLVRLSELLRGAKLERSY